MSIVQITKRDLLRSTLVVPAWYRVRIDSYETKMAANGLSQNYMYEGSIIKNADTGDVKFAGVPTPFWLFNSKALGFTVDFWRALGYEVAEDMRFDFSANVGKELDVFIGNETYQGRLVNSVKTHQYRKPRGE